MSAQTGGDWESAVETHNYVPKRGATPQGGNSIFVDQSESIVAAIGSNYLQNFLAGGTVEKGVGVLTQKRFYYKGRNFSGTGKGTSSANQEGVISIEDITFTMFTHMRPIGYLVFALLLTAVGLVLALVAVNHNAETLAFSLIAASPFYLLYFVKRSSLFLVAFPGGGFAFDVRYYPIADIRDFQRQLHLIKDHRREK